MDEVDNRFVDSMKTFSCLSLDVLEGKVSWLNVPTVDNQFFVHGSQLEFRPFKLENHNQYKCIIKSKQNNEILRTLIFNTYVNIHEKNDRKPTMSIDIDTTQLNSQGELKLICNTGNIV